MNDTDSSGIGDGIYDPRAVANLILDVIHKPPTNLSLQKLLYFVHGAFLLRKKKALVTGYFEAWTHGPVHPAVYAAFKEFESDPITGRAFRKDLRTGALSKIDPPEDADLSTVCAKVLKSLGSMTGGQPLRRLLVRSKAGERVVIGVLCHGRLLLFRSAGR